MAQYSIGRSIGAHEVLKCDGLSIEQSHPVITFTGNNERNGGEEKSLDGSGGPSIGFSAVREKRLPTIGEDASW